MTSSGMTRAAATKLMLGGGAIAAIPSLARAQTKPATRIGASPVETSAAVYFARDMGFFDKAGIEVEIQPLRNGAAIAAAIIAGSLDVGYCPVDVLAAIHRKGIALCVVAPCSEYVAPATAKLMGLALSASSTVRQAKDLSGKTIAVGTLNGLSEITARAWIDGNGGDASSVKFIETPNSTITVALDADRVDAGVVVEPFLSVLNKNDRVLAYGMDSIAKRFLIAAWVSSTPWAKDHADSIKRFNAAIHEANVWANQNPAKSAAIVAKATQLDPAVVATMTRSRYAEELTPALLQPLIDVAAKYEKFATFPAQELLLAPGR